MCCDWDPDSPNILESVQLHFSLNYIIAISKLDAVWLCHSRGTRLFSWGKFSEVSVRRADCRGDLFLSQTIGELKFFACDRRCFRAEMWWRVCRTGSRTGGRTGASPCITLVLFTSYKLPKTVTVSTLCLFGHVALWDFYLYFVEWGICVVITHQTNIPSICAAGLSIHTGSVRQYCASDNTSRGGSVPEWNFTPRRLWGIHTEAENWRKIPASKRHCE